MPILHLTSFFSTPTATTKIYTLSLHDALPISEQVYKNIVQLKGTPSEQLIPAMQVISSSLGVECTFCHVPGKAERSEEHTSELQSRRDLVCRLLLEKKKNLILTITDMQFY